MRRLLPVLLLGLLAGLFLASFRPDPDVPDESGDSGGSPDAIRRAVAGTIRGQAAALRGGDFPRALEFAAAGFRQAHTPESFAQIVTSGFLPLIAAADLRFGRCVDRDGLAVIQVLAVDDAGGGTLYRYALVQEQGRAWRIATVTEVGRFPASAPAPPQTSGRLKT